MSIRQNDELDGYTGRILRVDLSNKKLSIDNLNEVIIRKWVGGLDLEPSICTMK